MKVADTSSKNLKISEDEEIVSSIRTSLKDDAGFSKTGSNTF